MKIYVFENGKETCENLSGKEIKEKEEKMGRLLKVIIGHDIIPVDYDINQKPVEEHAWFKRREEERKDRR